MPLLYEQEGRDGSDDEGGRLRQELRLTRALTVAISQASNLDSALEQTLRVLCEETGWELGQGWLVEGEPPRLRPSSAWYGGSEAAKALRTESEPLSFSEGEALPGLAWAARRPVWIDDFSVEDRSPRARSARKAGFRAALAVPVPDPEQGVAAVLELLTRRRVEEDPGLLDVVVAVAAQLASFLRGERAEGALRASEERFRSLAETANDAIVSADADSVIRYANRCAHEMFGWHPGELVGRRLMELMPPGLRIAHEEGVRRFLATREPRIIGRTVELTGRRKDGSEFPVELSLAAWEQAGEQYFTGTLRDMSERKRVEEDLVRSRARLSEAASLGRLGSWEWDLIDGHVTRSKELSEIYGLDPEEVVSPSREQFMELVHPEDRAAVQAQVERSLQNPKPFPYVHRVIRPDGTQRLVQGRGRVELDDLGRPRRLVGVSQDVTDIKEYESALERLSRRYELILEAAGEGIFGMDPGGRFTFLNHAGAAMLDWSAEELLGKDTHSAIHHTRPDGSPYPHHECPIIKAAQVEGKAIRTDCLFWRKDGTSFPVDYLATPISEGGEVTGAVVVFRDTSEEHNSRREAEQLERRLRESERMDTVGRLAGGIAHDFNNLLAVILNYAALVTDELEQDNPRREDVEEIRRAAERAAALTEQLLLFSRQDPGRVEHVDLDAVVRDVERLLRRTLGEHIALQVRLAGDLPPIEADKGQLEQVLLNLALNARDAMPEGGTLAIETHSDGRPDAAASSTGGVRLVVRDNGEGMPPEVASHALDPFFTTKPPGQGTGLGLATVYGVVTRAGGRVDLSSQPGEGTQATIRLPAASGPRSEGLAASGAEEEAPAGQGETVLVVEDEDAVRRVAVRILEDAGYQVIHEGDPARALDLLESRDKPLDLLLTDVVMPGLSGGELAHRIPESHPETRVLFMSGYAPDERPHKDAVQPYDHMVAKPFSPRTLLSAVARALG
ncbi:MAG: PAS domain S-box protein [Actinomycetota bacterium]|nr:PAS domain S-box protein [Actinomycetota bacterium]